MMTLRILFFLLLFLTGPVTAGHIITQYLSGGYIHMRGSLVNGTCAVKPESLDMYVDMGHYRSNQFTGLGSYTEPVEFSVYLTDCNLSAMETVGIAFTGISDSKDPLVLRAGGEDGEATGVGLAIFDNKDNLLPLGQISFLDLQSLKKNAREAQIHFIARYRATSRRVTGGKADALTGFIIVYQ